MATHARILFVIAFALSWARAQVDISGTVLDGYTGKGVPGATVRLIGKNLPAVADANGAFRVSDATGLLPGLKPGGSGKLIANGPGFLFDHPEPGPAEIGIYGISGRRFASLHTGELGAGRWRFDAPRLPAGLYLCRVRTPAGEWHATFLASASGRPSAGLARIGDAAASTGTAPKAAKIGAAAPADTLLVSKPGYYPGKFPLQSLSAKGMEILLTDTAIAATATFMPDTSWNCGLPGGIPPPAKGDAAFQASLTIGSLQDFGQTQYGRRRARIVSGGTLAGDRLKGTVLTGGLDLELALPNGSMELEEILILRANDGANIYVRAMGVAPAGDPVARMVFDFEAPTGGAYAWLNTGTYAGTRALTASGSGIDLAVYEISKVAAADPKLPIPVPVGIAHQPRDCLKLTGTKGSSVFTENVTLGSSFSFTGKRGTRNIIPITGGTTSGRVQGRILSAGADYQLNGLDARYMLAPSDGEFILVRNCGPMGALVPEFETRADGPYAFLNANDFLSSDPGTGGGGVSITFYERK